MAQYIDKDTLIAEIERRMADILDECSKRKRFQFTLYGKTIALENLLSFINTIEVKEVDLEKEIKEEYLKCRWYGGKNNMFVILNEPQFNKIAKYFFELGLKAQKRE